MQFKLPDMSCGHCVGAIERAAHEVDPNAKVAVDLASHQVQVESARPPEAFAKAFTEAGYPPA